MKTATILLAALTLIEFPLCCSSQRASLSLGSKLVDRNSSSNKNKKKFFGGGAAAAEIIEESSTNSDGELFGMLAAGVLGLIAILLHFVEQDKSYGGLGTNRTKKEETGTDKKKMGRQKIACYYSSSESGKLKDEDVVQITNINLLSSSSYKKMLFDWLTWSSLPTSIQHGFSISLSFTLCLFVYE